jgi:CDP-glucose 4,6-dehydratase
VSDSLFGDRYRGRRVLVTGHTGFKGSWLALWLADLGAQVTGIALAPDTQPSHWELLGLDIADHRVDIRDGRALAETLKAARPEIVFHLAAQPLVRRSYREPLETWSTNVMGTANVLEACRGVEGLRGIVVVTSDKCYENVGKAHRYREDDRLGGHDPYSASKAAAELLAASYRSSFFHADEGAALASARAGNVIGGGDWAEDRLVPDLVRAVAAGRTLDIRSPEATRPWQHVLESLSGYLTLGQRLLEGRRDFAEPWNFGPPAEGNATVAGVLARLARHWPELAWRAVDVPRPHEAALLELDIEKARTRLGWQPTWSLDEAVDATSDWYRAFLRDGRVKSREQLAAYVAKARASRARWAAP